MIKHIVMFHLKKGEDKQKKQHALRTIKESLLSLTQTIDVLASIEVGINQQESPRSADLVLITTFKTWQDLEVYRVHPDHQKVVSVIKSYTERSVVVDYEL